MHVWCEQQQAQAEADWQRYCKAHGLPLDKPLGETVPTKVKYRQLFSLAMMFSGMLVLVVGKSYFVAMRPELTEAQTLLQAWPLWLGSWAMITAGSLLLWPRKMTG